MPPANPKMRPPYQNTVVMCKAPWGPMLVSRQDFHPTNGYGVGAQLLMYGDYDPPIRVAMCNALSARRQVHGDGVVCLNVGANIGAFAVPWALHMAEWGEVCAVEPQWFCYSLLMANMMINNTHRNMTVINRAMGAETGEILVPNFDYDELGSAGSLELRQYTEGDSGQKIDYSRGRKVPMQTVDSLQMSRLDLLFCDAEGMDAEVLQGARATLEQHHPIVVAEHSKCGLPRLRRVLDELGYKITQHSMDILAVHPADPTAELVVTS